MPLNLVLYIFTSAIDIVVGGIVFFQNPSQKINRVFAGFCIGLLGWLSTVYFFSISTSSAEALFIDHLSLVFGILAVHILFWFCYIFPRVTHPINKYVHIAFIVLSAATIFLTEFTDLMEVSVEFRNNVPYGYTYGSLYPLYVLYMIILALAIFYLLYIKYKELKGLERLQMTYLFFGATSGIVISFTLSLIIPTITENTEVSNYGYLGPVSLLTLVSYAIVRHRLFDVKIAARSIIFILVRQILIIFIGFTFYRLVRIFADFNNDSTVLLFISFASILVELIMARLIAIVKGAADVTLFQQVRVREVALEQFDHELAGILDFKALLDYITSTLHTILGVVNVGYVLVDVTKSGRTYENFQIGWTGFTEKEANIVVGYLNIRPKPIVFEELEIEIKDNADALETYIPQALMELMVLKDVEVIFPLIVKKQVMGFVMLGPKPYNGAYSSNDIERLKAISYPSAITIQNARLHAQLQESIAIQKSENISVISHELRTPATIIKEYAWMLLHQPGLTPEKIKEHLSVISKNTEKIVRTTNDALAVSEIENNGYILHLSPLDVYEVAKGAYTELLPQAKDKKVALTFSPTTRPESFVPYEGDKDKLALMLTHLVDNAIKFTPADGSISVMVDCRNNEYTITVEDTGVGIAKAAQDTIFDKFSKRQSVYTTTTSPGMGLGLYIANTIAHLHKGKIEVDSDTGRGSRFIVHLPVVEFSPTQSLEGSSLTS